ncbi:hypothetical protein CEE94_12830, partial [Lactobacillus crispatus]
MAQFNIEASPPLTAPPCSPSGTAAARTAARRSAAPSVAAPAPGRGGAAWRPAPAPPPRAESSRSSGYCVRSCDGRYFPVQARGGATPAQMCQAFCPATPTKVFYGSGIDGATAANGERYADSENAFAYRKALK